MGTHKIYSGIQGIRDNISGSLYGDCHELLAAFSLVLRTLACAKVGGNPGNEGMVRAVKAQ